MQQSLIESFDAHQKSLGSEAIGIVLITQYYESKLARDDIERALALNLENPMISEVVLLNEIELNLEAFSNREKIKQFIIPQRLTFSIAFAFANKHFPNRTLILGKINIFEI